MVVKAKKIEAAPGDARESGQSVLEFLLMLPILLAFTFLMVRINMAIQYSIVDQQYARMQTLYVAANSADYPRRSAVVSSLATVGFNTFTVGVSDNKPPDQLDDGETFSPKASVVQIARKGKDGSEEAQAEPTQRGAVRVRDTVTICTPLLSIGGKAARPGMDPKVAGNLNFGQIYSMAEDPKQFNFCSSPLSFVVGASDI